MGQTMDIVRDAASTVVTLLAAVALFWKFALPWLRKEIAQPAQETAEQVKNTHTTNLRDDLDRIYALVSKVDTKVEVLNAKVGEHLISAAGIDADTKARLSALERRL